MGQKPVLSRQLFRTGSSTKLFFLAVLLVAFGLLCWGHLRHPAVNEALSFTRPVENLAAGSVSHDWALTLRRSQGDLGWHWLAPHPTSCLEGSTVLLPGGQTIMTAGGVFCNANPNPDARPGDPLSVQGSKPMNVALYNIASDSWSLGPSLPTHIHHVFNSLFEYDGVLLLVGGVDGGVQSDFRTKPVCHDGLLVLDTRASNWEWVSLFSSILTYSATSQCTPTALNGTVHYCLEGSGLAYYDNDKQQFIQLDLRHLRATLEAALAAGHAFNGSHIYRDCLEERPLIAAGADWAEQTGLIKVLAEPPTFASHMFLFLEHSKEGGEVKVGYTNAREVKGPDSYDPSLPAGANTMTNQGRYLYSPSLDTWHRAEDTPDSISPREARATVQLPLDYEPWPELAGSIFTFGGQDVGERLQLQVTSDVLRYDPFGGSFRKVGHLPMKSYGMTAVYLAETNQVFLTGGEDATGQPCHRHAYLWDIPSPAQMEAYYRLDSQRPWRFTISSAHFGVYDVTQKLRCMVEEDNILTWSMQNFARDYLNDTMPQFWSADPTWGYYKMPLVFSMVRNGFPITMTCSAYDAICNLTD